MSLGEFDLIDRLLKPLAADEPGALGLIDDAAILNCPSDHQLVLTKDAIVEGAHFFADDPAATVGQKLLRVNLSDLAAMGAEPVGYLTVIARSEAIDDGWLEEFCKGLTADQALYKMHLLGGDLVSTPGPLTLTCTMIGKVPEGRAVKRSGAKPGDAVYVSGTVGESSMGLRIQTGLAVSEDVAVQLVDRYRVPLPRVELGKRLRGVASAMIDVSDGLLADLGHLANASSCGARLEVERLPVPDAVKAIPGGRAQALTGGDDYELLFTADPKVEAELKTLVNELGVPITRIGDIRKEDGIVDANGKPFTDSESGWRHF